MFNSKYQEKTKPGVKSENLSGLFRMYQFVDTMGSFMISSSWDDMNCTAARVHVGVDSDRTTPEVKTFFEMRTTGCLSLCFVLLQVECLVSIFWGKNSHIYDL
jgi:hypothetical protein